MYHISMIKYKGRQVVVLEIRS